MTAIAMVGMPLGALLILLGAIGFWVRERRAAARLQPPAADPVDEHYAQTPAAQEHAGTWDFDPAAWRRANR